MSQNFIPDLTDLCNTMNAITYGFATTAADFELGKKLFEEYVQSIGVDLSFQDFSKELATIGQQYNHPAGALLLAAQTLYRTFGFYEIPSYRFNPLEGTVYMEKEL